MKTISKSILFLILAACIAAGFTGCATQPAPNAAEKFIYTTVTNTVTLTNQVTQYTTNLIPSVVTNTQNQVVTLYQTNVTTQIVPQIVTTTNYVFATAPNTTSAVTAASAVINGFAPGAGTIAGSVATALLALWAAYRNNQAKSAAQQVAANGVQAIETAREIIKGLPSGQVLLTQYDNWLMQHQQDANVANEVAQLVTRLTAGEQWANAAQTILDTALQNVQTPAQPAVAMTQGKS